MSDRSRKRPRDVNELARQLVDEATGEQAKYAPSEGKDPADSRGRSGGLRGGRARAEKLTPEQRKAIATKAAAARWGQQKAEQ